MNEVTIKEITWEQIEHIWKFFLWPHREDIKPMSSMVLDGGYDTNIYKKYVPVFLGAFVGDKLVGVNSGHQCSKKEYRSRGLYVMPEFRKEGIGTKLLEATAAYAKKKKCTHIWSYPREGSQFTYLKAGYALITPFVNGNCYAVCNFNA